MRLAGSQPTQALGGDRALGSINSAWTNCRAGIIKSPFCSHWHCFDDRVFEAGTSKMAAKLYVDHMSQPSRSCIIFCRFETYMSALIILESIQKRTLTCKTWFNNKCRVNQLPVEEQLINIAKGGTKSAEYQSINPLGKVPFYKVRVLLLLLHLTLQCKTSHCRQNHRPATRTAGWALWSC